MEDTARYCHGCMDDSAGAAVCPHCGYVAGREQESVLHLAPGTLLKQRYLVGRVLGDGGFGITYLGRDLVLDSKVAIKEYFPAGVAVRTRGEPHVFPASASFRQDYQFGMERFLDEARLVRKFKDHPNIVRVEDFFPENDTAYMILEFLDGITLEKYLEQHGGKIEWQSAVNCMVWVMDALREVHAAGVLHRDVSPDNIFLVRSGHVKVIDFGAARQAMSQKSMNLSVILKHGYAPFEQYESKGQQGPWTDVYAASATLYRAITGQLPPAAPDRFTKDTLVKPSAMGIPIPPEKEAVLWKGLALRVEDRYQDMLKIENALLGRDPHPTLPPGPLPPRPTPAPVPVPPSPVLPPKWLLGGIAAVVLAAIGYLLLAKPAAAPEVRAFSAEPQNVAQGAALTLSWEVSAADTVEIEGLGKQALNGKLTVSPAENKTYTLIARSKRGAELRKQVSVTVTAPTPPAPAPRIVRFELSPAAVDAGSSAQLSWQVENAKEVKLDGTPVAAAGNRELREPASRDFLLEVTGADGAKQESRVTLTVTPLATQKTDTRPPRRNDVPVDNTIRPLPSSAKIVSFGIQPASIQAGQAATLVWSTIHMTRVTISPQPGPVASSGEIRIEPRTSGRYTLVAIDAQGRESSATASVQVLTPVPNPEHPERIDRTPPPSGLSWTIAHDHEGLPIGINPRDRTWNHCEGVLRLTAKTLHFDTRFPGDSFHMALAEIDEIKTNRMPIHGMKAFHLKLRSGRNFNFVSLRESPDRIVGAVHEAMK